MLQKPPTPPPFSMVRRFLLILLPLITVLVISGSLHFYADYEKARIARESSESLNADWAAAAVFDVSQQLSKDYSQGLLVALHKNGKADAYMVFLFNTYPEVKERITTTLPSLQFKN
jgi:hypothetical protein